MNKASSLFQPKLSGWAIICMTSALMLYAIGCLFVFEISSAEAIDAFHPERAHLIVTKQLLFGFLGFLIAFGIYSLDIEKWMRWAPVLFTIQLIALAAVFLPVIGVARNGSYRWLQLGPMLIQPSEFAKITLALYILTLTKEGMERIDWKFWVKTFALLFLIVIEPDNRTCAITASVLFAALFFSPVPLRRFILPLLLFATVSVTVASQFDYVQKRVQVYINPDLDPHGRGYQPMQAKIAVGSGGLYGRGLGHSLQKFSYLPEAQNDYIAAIIAEEWGFVGITLLLALYSTMIASAFAMILKAKNAYLSRIMSLFLYIFAAQIVINLCVVVGLFPSTGLNLPLVSQGGSSLWANSIVIAVILSCDRKSALQANFCA